MTKLTKAQKETLNLMRDTGAYIRVGWTSYDGVLCNAGGEKIKNISSMWRHELSCFFTPKKSRHYGAYIYTIRPDAEISDACLEAENQRRIKEVVAREDAKKAAIEAECQRAVEWFGLIGPYTVDFSGQHFTGNGAIMLNDKYLMGFNLMYQSSDYKTFEDMMAHPENIEHYGRIREMLRRANRVDQWLK